MFSGSENRREINPRVNADILSIVLFIFAIKTIRKGLRKDFETEDIYEVLNEHRSHELGDHFAEHWKDEVKKSNPALLRPLFKMFGREYVVLGVFIFVIETALLIIEPILTGKVVSYFEPGQTKVSRNGALLYAIALIGSILSFTLCDHSYWLMLQQLSMKMRIACCSLMYRKCLKLNLSSSDHSIGGKVVTLMTKDVLQFNAAVDFGHVICQGAVQLLIMTYVMYREIGVSVLFGVSLVFVMIPVNVFLGKKTADRRLMTAEKTDERVKLTQEILTAMRIIKMYTWELFFAKSVNSFRKKEILNLRILFYIKAIALSIGQLSSRLAFYICVMAYIALGNHITAEKAFVVIGCFAVLRSVLTVFLPLGITQLAEFKTSIQRITSFLLLEEVVENRREDHIDDRAPQICLKKITIRTDKGGDVLKDVCLDVKNGITVLMGPTGAGKSTILKLLLGDIKHDQGVVDNCGKMSYASQEPWLFPGSVKQNIIFGEKFVAKRYDNVMKVCALKKDFDAFPNGDKTCLTDRGLNLSRGQKIRINLARAVYKQADIYLLDDCLSAVDNRVGKQIFYECIKGFLRDKICVLVTHQNQFLKEANNIILLDKGRVIFQGDYLSLKGCGGFDFRSALTTDDVSSKIASETEQEEEEEDEEETKLRNSNHVHDAKLSSADKNVYEETKQEGAVDKMVYYTYFTSGGGVKMLVVVLIFFIAVQATASWSDYFVSFWVDMEQEMSGFRFNHTTNTTEYRKLEESHGSIMKQYSIVILSAAIFTLLRAIVFFVFTSRASNSIHDKMLDKILGAGMIFFDKNLSGNVLNRFSRDLGIIDEQMPSIIIECLGIIMSIVGILLVVSSVNLYFIIPSIIFTTVLILARRLYLPTGRSIRRLEGATRSPVIGHLTATLEGLTTIRASRAQKILRKEFDKHQDFYSSVSYMHLVTARAFGFYLDIICAVYITVITFTFIFFKTETLAGKVGLAITQSFSLTGLLQWGVRQWAELENQMTSVERVLEYTKIESETKSGDKPNDWPLDGKIIYDKVNLRYFSSSKRILKDVSICIEPKQKVGVVGRTGAGKSSIISTLFRLYEFSGTITIDGVDINGVDTQLLRSKISIIPQDPVLFSETVRNNLDPYRDYTDDEIWDALEEVGMKKTVENLNSSVLDGGTNFSIGQRQLLCLARAIVRKNVILVLDEATANVDPDTDAVIQRTIRRKFVDCTVITVAHRLHTVMDSDRILVMDSGSVLEYDNPKVLLENKDSIFYNMVKEAGLL